MTFLSVLLDIINIIFSYNIINYLCFTKNNYFLNSFFYYDFQEKINFLDTLIESQKNKSNSRSLKFSKVISNLQIFFNFNRFS